MQQVQYAIVLFSLFSFDAVIGTDDIDWNGIIAVTKSVPACEWAIVEHEKGVLSDVAKCAEALRKMI